MEPLERILTAVPAPATTLAAAPAEIGIFTWIFFGFCALIVIMQAMPALLMMVGMARGLKEVLKPAAHATHK